MATLKVVDRCSCSHVDDKMKMLPGASCSAKLGFKAVRHAITLIRVEEPDLRVRECSTKNQAETSPRIFSLFVFKYL